jgi:hypothetical protein
MRSPNRQGAAVGIAAVAVAAVMLAVAGVLWLRYGSTVFFQTLAAGLAACF